jgi:IS30 family transposase
MVADGVSVEVVARELKRSVGFVYKVRKEAGGVARRAEWDPSASRLSACEREEIRAGLLAGDSFRTIAGRLGRAPSTVSREVTANGGRVDYRAWRAHRHASELARRPKVPKLVECVPLREFVEAALEGLWSPVQITRRLRDEFPHDPMMRVSHETIYQSLFVQGRGALRKELAACLRTGRAIRQHRTRLERAPGIKDMVMITDRPAEADDRAVPGHWEGDLIMGSNNRSAVGTLVERSTRFVMLLHLRGDHTAATVRNAMAAKIAELPRHLVKTITWDQGREMAQHREFTIDTGIQVYFCDPHSPWQRGSNENTNGLLRQYMPKGISLAQFSPTDLDAIAASLNGRPRQTLNWMTPSEKLAQVVATTA